MGHRRSNSKKIGLPPGSLVYTGDKKEDEITIEIFSFSPESYHRKFFSENKNFSSIRYFNDLNWIRVNGIHNPLIIEKIGHLYGLDNLIMEDILNPSHRPKLEERENYLCIITKMLVFNSENKDFNIEQISLILGKDYLITFQESDHNFFNSIDQRLALTDGKMRKKSIGYLAYSILDTIIDNYFLVLEDIEERMDKLEGNLMDKASREYLNAIFELQQQVILMKKVIFPITEVTLKLTNEEGENFFLEDTKLYLKDLHDHSLMIYENMENLSTRFSNLSQLYHAALGSDTNEIMKVLTVMSATFIPLTFLAGLYGMNFNYMPELNWVWGYYFILLLMASIFTGMLIFFKRKRWW